MIKLFSKPKAKVISSAFKPRPMLHKVTEERADTPNDVLQDHMNWLASEGWLPGTVITSGTRILFFSYKYGENGG